MTDFLKILETIFFIIYIFWTIVLIFVAMFIPTFWPLYTPAFFR